MSTVFNNSANNSNTPPERGIREDLGYKVLVKFIASKTGLDIQHYRDNFIQRRLKLKLKEKKLDSYSEYANLVKNDQEEFDELMKFITINYTSFFRDNDVFNYFNDIILPEIYSKKKNVKILSAGCSSGEEPYTLAILVKEYCDRKKIKPYASIRALDVDRTILAKARKGVYDIESLKQLDPKYVHKYFEEVDGMYHVSSEIKRMVQFGIHDITEELSQRNFDTILCRNVFIYFTNAAKDQILDNFYKAINLDGYLIIGKTEMMPMYFRDRYQGLSHRLKIFRKLKPE
jgi:chemotaxis protein methyltransferase CheR